MRVTENVAFRTSAESAHSRGCADPASRPAEEYAQVLDSRAHPGVAQEQKETSQNVMFCDDGSQKPSRNAACGECAWQRTLRFAANLLARARSVRGEPAQHQPAIRWEQAQQKEQHKPQQKHMFCICFSCRARCKMQWLANVPRGIHRKTHCLTDAACSPAAFGKCDLQEAPRTTTMLRTRRKSRTASPCSYPCFAQAFQRLAQAGLPSP